MRTLIKPVLWYNPYRFNYDFNCGLILEVRVSKYVTRLNLRLFALTYEGQLVGDRIPQFYAGVCSVMLPDMHSFFDGVETSQAYHEGQQAAAVVRLAIDAASEKERP